MQIRCKLEVNAISLDGIRITISTLHFIVTLKVQSFTGENGKGIKKCKLAVIK